MKSKWIVLSGLSFGIGFCLSISVNKNIEKSLLMGLGASASSVASVSILSKLSKIDEHLYKDRLKFTDQKRDVEVQIEQLQSEKASAGESLAMVVEQLDKKNEVYTQLSDRNTRLESDKEDLESVISQYSAELEDISLLIEERNSEVDQLNQSKSDNISILEGLQNKYNSYEQRIEEQKHSLSHLENEVSSLEEQRSKLFATSEGLTEEITSIERNRTELHNSISDLELRISQTIAEENSLTESITALNSQTKVKEAEITNLDRVISKLNNKKQIIEEEKTDCPPLSFVYPGNIELDDRQKVIREICENRKIDICTHYTRVDFLESILRQGLIPRAKHKEYGLNCTQDSEEQSHGNHLNISHPSNDPFKRSSKKNKKKWVIISYKKEILWELDCEYYPQGYVNETSSSIAGEKRNSEEIFGNMFLGRDSNYTKDVKAEVLVFNVIPSCYLESVTFYDDEVLKEWIDDTSFFSFNYDLFGLRDTIPAGCETAAEVQKPDLY